MESILVVLLAGGALLVRLGQAVAAMGLSRAKNVASAGLRSLADICIASLCFWAVGAAILFQRQNPVFGIDFSQLIGWSGISPNFFAMLVTVLIATGIVAPAVAERSRLGVPLAVGALLAGLLVPMVGHWVWYGWLGRMGFVDLGGAAPIHLVPALCAATAAMLVGPRDGKYNRDGSSNMIPGHSVPMIMLSLLLILAGWTPYVLIRGPEDANAIAANIFIAAAAGGAVNLLIGQIRFGKIDMLLVCSGVLGALVSITAAAGAVGTTAAFFIGAVAGIIVPWMTVMIDLRWKIDDPAGVVAIHGIGGIWALLAAAIFAREMAILDHLKLLGVHLLGIIVIGIIAVAFTAILLLVMRSTNGLRVKDADEYDGLDLAEHDINAHPDFQQTMIKSYHLREA